MPRARTVAMIKKARKVPHREHRGPPRATEKQNNRASRAARQIFLGGSRWSSVFSVWKLLRPYASRHSLRRPSRTIPSGDSPRQRSITSGQRGWKRQPRRDVRRVRIALAKANVGNAHARLRRQHRGQQRARIGMRGSRNSASTRRMLHDAAEIHHRDLGRDVLDHREIVADEQIGQAELAPQFGEQIEDLRLHRHIQRAGRLVAHNDARAQHQGAGDRHALALAAGKLRWETASAMSADRPTRASISITRSRRCAAVMLPCAASGRPTISRTRWRGIERGKRVLEHRLDQPRAFAPVHGGEAASVDQNLACARRQQAEDQPRQRGLAAAGFADDAKHVAGAQAEATRRPPRAPRGAAANMPARVRNTRRTSRTSMAGGHAASARVQSGGRRHR